MTARGIGGLSAAGTRRVLCAGGGRDLLAALAECCKILLSKAWDERHAPPEGERTWRRVPTAARIHELYFQASSACYAGTFFDASINLPDDAGGLRHRIIGGVGFTQCEPEALCAAFGWPFRDIFRGALGQYHTPVSW